MKVERLDYKNSAWLDYVSRYERSNIFSSPEMNEAFNCSDGFEVKPLFAVHENKIVAAMFPVVVKIKTHLPHSLTNRIIMYSTPLFERNEYGYRGINMLMGELINEAKGKALFIEIRNSEKFDLKESGCMIKDFKYFPYQNYLIDLKRGEENIINSLNSYTRNHIRKSEKAKCTIREINDNELHNVIELLEELYKRKNIPFIHRSIFHNAFKLLKPKGYIRVIVMELNSQIIASRISLNYNKTVYDWYAASKPEFNRYYPNEALAWNTIKWACMNGYEIFDFGGGALRGQEYGPAKFKEKFRGDLVEFGRYRYILNKPLYFLGSKIYNLRTSKK